jgi:hypothetical protein
MVTSPDSAENSLALFDTTSTQDVWDIAAIFIPVKGLLWPALEKGFTIASWVKLSEDEENVVKISKSSSGNIMVHANLKDRKYNIFQIFRSKQGVLPNVVMLKSSLRKFYGRQLNTNPTKNRW